VVKATFVMTFYCGCAFVEDEGRKLDGFLNLISLGSSFDALSVRMEFHAILNSVYYSLTWS
jgi:hypothetical protein